jgi:uncharacterized membrane protein YccC
MAREAAATHAMIFLHDIGPDAGELSYALSAFLSRSSAGCADALEGLIDQVIDTQPCAGSLFVAASSVRILIDQNRRTLTALEDLRRGRRPSYTPRLPLFRAPEVALRNALRVFLAMLTAACFVIATGWPTTSYTMMLLGATAAISATAPSPQSFGRAALIAMPTAFVLALITNFLILDGADDFPLLALGMAPAIIGSGLLVASGNAKVAPVGALLLVFIPVLLSPSNPQSYDPQTYLIDGSLGVLAVIALSIMLGALLPTSDARKRAWILRSFRIDLRRALSDTSSLHDPDALAFRGADRLGQLGSLRSGFAEVHAADLHNGLRWDSLISAAWRIRLALSDPQVPLSARLEGRAALKAEDPGALRRAADRLLAPEGETRGRDQSPRRHAAAILAWMATLIESNSREIEDLRKGVGR